MIYTINMNKYLRSIKKEEALKMRQQGFTLREIALKLDMSHEWVRQHVDKNIDKKLTEE